MAIYHCYLLGADGFFELCEEIDCDSDRAAIALGAEILVARARYPAYEVWRCGRRIHAGRREALALTTSRTRGVA